MVSAEDLATQIVRTISPKASVRDAANVMAVHNIGFLPVVSDGRALGVLTDRDIALRSLKHSSPAEVQVEDIMTRNLIWVDEEAKLDEVAAAMADHQVRRVLVHDAEGKLAGVISLDDLAIYTQGDQTAGQIIQKMAKPHRPLRVSAELAAMPVGKVCQRNIHFSLPEQA